MISNPLELLLRVSLVNGTVLASEADTPFSRAMALASNEEVCTMSSNVRMSVASSMFTEKPSSLTRVVSGVRRKALRPNRGLI